MENIQSTNNPLFKLETLQEHQFSPIHSGKSFLQIFVTTTHRESDQVTNFIRSEYTDDIYLDNVKLESGNTLFPIQSPLVFNVTKEKDLFCTEIEEIDYPLAEYSRHELKELIEEYISFLWDEYANEPDENLELFGPKIKQYLLATFKESV